MKERPILFNGPMVRAVLAGTKTQTRRLLKPAPQMVTAQRTATWEGDPGTLLQLLLKSGRSCPYGQPGDRLWVREAWARDDEDGQMIYRADVGRSADANAWERGRRDGVPRYRWRPSIHMPRWASRITLEVVSVRVERLQDISATDALAEGITHRTMNDPRVEYQHLWESITGPGSWDANPWVWVVEFKRLDNCGVRGMVAPGAMCGAHKVGGGCGDAGPCKHKEGGA